MKYSLFHSLAFDQRMFLFTVSQVHTTSTAETIETTAATVWGQNTTGFAPGMVHNVFIAFHDVVKSEVKSNPKMIFKYIMKFLWFLDNKSRYLQAQTSVSLSCKSHFQFLNI